MVGGRDSAVEREAVAAGDVRAILAPVKQIANKQSGAEPKAAELLVVVDDQLLVAANCRDL